MSLSNIREMNNDKMHIGSHGVNHCCWKFLTKKKQEEEIKKSLMYFKRNKINVQNFSVCYPYGSFNNDTKNILVKYNVKFGYSNVTLARILAEPHYLSATASFGA